VPPIPVKEEKKWPSVQSVIPAEEIGGIAKRAGCFFVLIANIKKDSMVPANAPSAGFSAS
jgi:hypothetical protein